LFQMKKTILPRGVLGAFGLFHALLMSTFHFIIRLQTFQDLPEKKFH
jgi:hypothetical protein